MSSLVRDGVQVHHFGIEPRPAVAAEVADLLEEIVDAARASPDRLEEVLAGKSAVDLADDLVAELRRRVLPRDRLHAVARHLVEYGTARDAVKLGLVMLGECGGEDDRDLLLLLGTLEEFTLYAVVALVKTQPDRHRVAYTLARRVTGWGRIHAVRRLEGGTDPDIKGWLLREGFRNEIMDEYLVHLAATTGDLHGALLEPEVDAALLDGAGDILSALALGGPAEDLTDYAEAVPVLHRYAELVGRTEPTLRALDALLVIRGWASNPDLDLTWPEGEPARLIDRYEALLARPGWLEPVLAGLDGPSGFHVALACALRLDLPVLPQTLRHLAREPFDAYAWHCAVDLADEDGLASVITLAQRLLPVEQLAGGPAGDLGLGPEHAPDRALESVITELADHPWAGLELFRVALRNRVVRVRYSAFRTLTTWPSEGRPSDLRDWIAAAASAEPDPDLRQRMREFLATPEPP
ncbi:hypothetical protein EDD29_3716 [Actinocorallia herbida]|uniref:Uncharacterized protein n=1 Tax=Actinocorallia herbida TaxID=58109 RepID=A0A3N1CXY0_9ACTN|nr:hypothetical protein [Actinocorallia herbida]ROO86153.1 hypothetical protein EDD29_3716 [Actinocorallia herbida]